MIESLRLGVVDVVDAVDVVVVDVGGLGVAPPVGALAAGWIVGRRYFPLFLPRREVASVLAATAAMAVVLVSVQTPQTLGGLLLLIGAGGLAYVVALAALQGRRALRFAQRLPRPKVRIG